MTDHDDVLKDLDAALQVEPSRAFADGVRARVNRSRTNTTRVWWGLAAAASVGLATMTLWRPSVETPAAVRPVSTQAAAATATASAPTPVVSAEPTVTKDRAVPPVTRRETSEPRLEVITNQGVVLQQLWADYRGRPLVMAEGESVVEGLALKPIAVDPIVVRPIVVTEIGKEPGPAGATPIIRRADATRETK